MRLKLIVKYEGYIKKQEKEAEKMLEYENVLIPEDFDYQSVQNLALEAREKLNKITPYFNWSSHANKWC